MSVDLLVEYFLDTNILVYAYDRLKPAASYAILNGSGQGGFMSWL